MKKYQRLGRITLNIILVTFLLISIPIKQGLATEKDHKKMYFSGPVSETIFNILAAEMSLHAGDYDQAVNYYLKTALQSKNPALAQRTLKIAVQTGMTEKALLAAKRWVILKPDALGAHQALALLELQVGHHKKAAKELLYIQKVRDKKNKKGIAAVISLLRADLNTEHVYHTFKEFAKSHTSSIDVQLALAGFALRDKRFEEVIVLTAKLKNKGTKKQKIQMVVFSVKALSHLKRNSEAIKVMESIVKTTKNKNLKLDYARLLVLDNRAKEATEVFNELHKNYPDNAEILNTLGLLYLDQKDYVNAKVYIQKLLKYPAREKEAHYFMGQIYEGMKKNKAALVEYRKVNTGTLHQEAQMRIAKLLYKSQGLAGVKKYLQQERVALPKTQPPTHLLLIEAEILSKAKKYQQSLKLYNQAYKLDDEDADILYARSLVHEKIGKFKQAILDLRTILKKHPENVTVLNALGYTLTVHTKKYTEARGYIKKALALSPNDGAIIDSMGWVEYRLGNIESAEMHLRKAYKNLPDPEVASHLIEVLSILGKKEEAKKILNEMLKEHPKDELLQKVKNKIVSIK